MNINEIIADVEELFVRVSSLEKKTKSLSADIESVKSKSESGETGESDQTNTTNKENET